MSEENQQQIEQTNSEPITQEAQNVDTTPKAFEIPTEAQDFVGEGKKYKSAEDALRSVPHAQEHIKTLESELAQAREELNKRKTTEELLDELKSGFQSQGNTTQGTEMNQDTIMQLVNQTLEKREQTTKAQINAKSVANKFTEKFGSQAEEVYNSLARDAGLTLQQLHNLSATSPNVVLKLAGLDNKPSTTVSKTQSTVNTETLNKTTSQELSARVPRGASTKDLVNAWRAAGEKVKQSLNS